MAKTLTVYLAADLKNFNQGMDDAGRKASGLGSTMSGMLGPALLGAAAAAGAFAIKLGVDGVKAAAEDEAAAAKLAQTLQNVGLAHDTAPVEEYIGSLERSLGVADDKLRPAYDRLIRSIGDTEGANKALALALDISAGSGKSLDAVVQALGKGYDGNTAGLAKLGAGIDSATLKTGDMEAITAKLASTFSGQAQTSANTYQGQLARLQIGVENLTEAFGYGLLNSMNDTEGQTQTLVDAMADLEPIVQLLGQRAGETASGLAQIIGPLAELASGSDDATGETSALGSAIDYMINDFPLFWNGLDTASMLLGKLTGATDLSDESMRGLTSATVSSALAAGDAKVTFTDLNPVLEETGKTALQSAGSYQTLYEKIAAAQRAARDFAGTSGTVSSAIAQGLTQTPGAQAAAAANASRPNTTSQQAAQALAAIAAAADARTGRPTPTRPSRPVWVLG